MGSRSEKGGFRAEVAFPTPEDAEAAYAALLPEISTSKRFTVSLERKDNVLFLRVHAEDLSALRAALNSYLRWIALIENIIKDVLTKSSQR